MEKSNFDQLLQRYLTGKVSEKERIKIEAWLDVVKTDDVTDLELSKEDEEKIFQKITGTIQDEGQITKQPLRTREIPVFQWAIGIAAALLLAVSYFIWNGYNGSDGVEKMILNDGTIVWLRGEESKLSYYEKPGETGRYAELTGEALFEVTKDANRPFILKCGEITIKVLGTSFSVKTLNNSLELEVLTGRVNLSSENDKAGIDVEPNQKIIYTGKTDLIKTPLNETEVSTLTKDTEYDMQFMNATLDKVLDRIEKKFEIDVKIENNQITKCRITADFTDHSLESTFQMISEVLDFKYKIDGNIVTVTGAGCK